MQKTIIIELKIDKAIGIVAGFADKKGKQFLCTYAIITQIK